MVTALTLLMATLDIWDPDATISAYVVWIVTAAALSAGTALWIIRSSYRFERSFVRRFIALITERFRLSRSWVVLCFLVLPVLMLALAIVLVVAEHDRIARLLEPLSHATVPGFAPMSLPSRLLASIEALTILWAWQQVCVALSLWGTFPEPVSLQALERSVFPNTPGRQLKVAHLSDLHITVTEDRLPVEFARYKWKRNHRQLPFVDPLRTLKSLLSSDDVRQRLDSADVVLITGDITDSGAPEEWAFFLHEFDPWRKKLVLIPGNHDVNIIGRGDMIHLDTRERRVRTARIYCALKVLVALCGEHASVWRAQRLVPLSQFAQEHEEFLDRLQQWLKNGDVVPLEEAGPQLLYLWDALFPLVFVVPGTDSAFLVCNSIEASGYTFSNAFGHISSDELARLRELIIHFRAAGMSVFHAVHHHVGLLANESVGTLEAATVFSNADEYLSVLLDDPTGDSIVFHGHRHYEGTGQLEETSRGCVRVISAASTTFGHEPVETRWRSEGASVAAAPRCGFRVWSIATTDRGRRALSDDFVAHPAIRQPLLQFNG